MKAFFEKTTYASYTNMVKSKIVPYFEKKDITVASLRANDIQMFYANELKTVSTNTVIHEHANIHRALKYAVKMDLIDFNPADKVDRPKNQKYIAEHYNLEELAALFEATKNHYLGLLIQVTAFYGLRRSCASLLLANGVTLKEIQEWLGYSDIATTADIYSHLDFKSKISSAYLMDGVLNLPEPVIKEDWGVE